MNSIKIYTVRQLSLVPFYILSHYIEMDKTSRIYIQHLSISSLVSFNLSSSVFVGDGIRSDTLIRKMIIKRV